MNHGEDDNAVFGLSLEEAVQSRGLANMEGILK